MISQKSGERSGLVTGTQLRTLRSTAQLSGLPENRPGVLASTVTGSQTSSSTGSLGNYSVNGTRTNQKELTV
jgi:hypothetical protein